MLTAPLKRMRLTQPFGVDYLGNNGPGGKSYADIGLKAGHNGWDLSAQVGTEVLACMDGDLIFTDGGTGYGRDIRIKSKALGLEVVYGHLDSLVGENNRTVKAGEVIALSDNTGFSTGPHLHFGLRLLNADQNDGYYGYVDPTPFFAADTFDLPVDKGYWNNNPPSVLVFATAFLYFLRSQKRVPSKREYTALRYGYWPLRDVLDPAMWLVWSEMTYPEAKKRGIVK